MAHLDYYLSASSSTRSVRETAEERPEIIWPLLSANESIGVRAVAEEEVRFSRNQIETEWQVFPLQPYVDIETSMF